MIYWTLKSVSELASLPRKQRRRVHEQCLRRHFWFARATTRSVTAYTASIVSVAAIVLLGITISEKLGLAHGTWFVFVLALIGFEVSRFVCSRIAIPVLRPFYHEFILTDEKHVA